MSLESLIEAARQGRGPLKHARTIRRFFRELRLPVVRPAIGALAIAAMSARRTWRFTTKFFVREPYFRYRCEAVGRRLNLEGAVPQILGNGRIHIGDDVTIGSSCTWDLAYSMGQRPELTIGNRVSLNYGNIISVASSVRIGDDTLIAGRVTIFDNTSHPTSPAKRLMKVRIDQADTAPVVIGANVWIGIGAIILRGVEIGDNSIVAAGAVVTRSVPPNVIVAGNPARVVRELTID